MAVPPSFASACPLAQHIAKYSGGGGRLPVKHRRDHA